MLLVYVLNKRMFLNARICCFFHKGVSRSLLASSISLFDLRLDLNDFNEGERLVSWACWYQRFAVDNLGSCV